MLIGAVGISSHPEYCVWLASLLLSVLQTTTKNYSTFLLMWKSGASATSKQIYKYVSITPTTTHHLLELFGNTWVLTQPQRPSVLQIFLILAGLSTS